MVLADDLADDAGGLHVLGVVGVAKLVHREETTTVDGLKTVPHIGQGTTDYHAHGIVDIVAGHFVLDVHIFKDARRATGHFVNLIAHTCILYHISWFVVRYDAMD